FDYFFFFFQAEDGIRDFHVTGVQTCALPISVADRGREAKAQARPRHSGRWLVPPARPGGPSERARAPKQAARHGERSFQVPSARSEERRVGIECGAWRLAGVYKRKFKDEGTR